MVGILELSNHESKKILINVLRTGTDIVASTQEEMSNVNREMEILGKNNKEMLGTKQTH